MSRYVLVHGSWHGEWCWEKVVPLLKEQGQEPVTVDLLGHGQDMTPPGQIALTDYVAQVTKIVKQSDERAILVGHSFGGVVISGVAEAMPDHIKQMIFVCAFMPDHDQSLFELGQQDKKSLVLQNLVEGPGPDVLSVKQEVLVETFYHDCSEEDQKWAVDRVRPEPMAPVMTKVQLSDANYGKVARHYIRCSEDQAITLWLQDQMLAVKPCDASTLKSSHSPFLSQPDELVAYLVKIGSQS